MIEAGSGLGSAANKLNEIAGIILNTEPTGWLSGLFDCTLVR